MALQPNSLTHLEESNQRSHCGNQLHKPIISLLNGFCQAIQNLLWLIMIVCRAGRYDDSEEFSNAYSGAGKVDDV